MANLEWQICNTLNVAVGKFTVDEGTTLKVPRTTDPSGTKLARDMGVGDYFTVGRSQTYKITAVVEPE